MNFIVSLSLFFSLFHPFSLFSVLSLHQKQVLTECLEKTWGVDVYTSRFLCKYFSEDDLVDEFIHQSKKLNIPFSIDKELSILPEMDGVIQARQFHPVVFETPYVRIMEGRAQPGEKEPFHIHAWKSLLVIFEEAHYFVEYANGSNELLHLSPGVYELLPEDAYSCTNRGNKKENCLRFEVKD
jgi:hypothetical protein